MRRRLIRIAQDEALPSVWLSFLDYFPFRKGFGVGLVGLSYADCSDRIALIYFIFFQVGVSGYRREADVE